MFSGKINQNLCKLTEIALKLAQTMLTDVQANQSK
jgi:hypothetical protein